MCMCVLLISFVQIDSLDGLFPETLNKHAPEPHVYLAQCSRFKHTHVGPHVCMKTDTRTHSHTQTSLSKLSHSWSVKHHSDKAIFC